ncbi:MAG: hypothetical protein AAB017_09760, partial [Nitrospirota bacterium]
MRRLFFVMLIAMMLSLPQVVFSDDEISYSGSSTIGMSILEAGAVKAFEQKTGLKFKSIEQPGS